MHKIIFLFLLFCLKSPPTAKAQPIPVSCNYPKDYFRSPLDISLFAAGTFAELRPNHYHSGLDLKTQGREGLPVFAAASGYVSRIRVSATGFGYAIYINHPNGYTTVYGHLECYNKRISDYIEAKQYEKESFEMDYMLKPHELKVEKGAVIGLSGNTGSSGGPHLHFEIRDTKTEKIINPQLVGIYLYDSRPPDFKKLAVYTGGDLYNAHLYNLSYKKGFWQVPKDEIIFVNGSVAFGTDVSDKQNNNQSNNGIYLLELKSDGVSIFEQRFETFAFDETRFVNAHIDFDLFQKKKTLLHRCHAFVGDDCSMYTTLKSKGILHFNDDAVHQIEITASDVFGNAAIARFRVQYKACAKAECTPNTGHKFSYKKENSYTNSEFKIKIPAGALYDSISFDYQMEMADAGCFSKMHHVHNPEIPLHKAATIFIKPNRLPDFLRKKALIVNITSGKNAVGGVFEGEYMKANVKQFGDYAIMIDTVPPKIRLLHITNNVNTEGTPVFAFDLSDNLSGIKSYRAEADGKWLLTEYDAKSGNLIYRLDGHLPPGKHQLKITVIDNCENVSHYEGVVLR